MAPDTLISGERFSLDPARPAEARVSLRAVVENYRLLEGLAGEGKVCAVVKADAYGHGIVPVATALNRAGCVRFAVSGIDEGLVLRESGVTGTVLALFGIPPQFSQVAAKERVTPLVHGFEELSALGESTRAGRFTLPVHLNFDTGMARLGFRPEDAGQLAQALRANPALRVEGVATHLARAGESKDFTALQLGRFRDVLATLKGSGVETGMVHAANSAATLAEPDARFDGVRAGIALYGGEPAPGLPGADRLKPALEWVTKVLAVRRVPAGTPLSYGGTYLTVRDSVIATLAIGYADGYRRGLGNDRGRVLVGSGCAPVRGRVCMDLTLVDVTDIPGVKPGDEAVLIGRRGGLSVPSEELARKLDTINYEVLCGIGKRVRRVHLQ